MTNFSSAFPSHITCRSPTDRQSGHALFIEAMAMPTDTEEEKAAKISAVKSIYNRLGVDADARHEVERLTTLALDSALKVNVNCVRTEMLRRFADSLVARAK